MLVNLPGPIKLSKHYELTNQPEVIVAKNRMYRKIGLDQQQATPLTKQLFNQLLINCDNSISDLRNQVLLRLGYETHAPPIRAVCL